MRYRTLLKRLSKTTTVDALDKRAKVRVMATYYSHGEPHARIIVDARVTNVHAQDNGQPLIAAELDEAQPLIAAALDEANLREKLAEKGAPHEHAREVRFYPRAVDGPHAPPDYRYMVDVVMLWLTDADGLPRMEHGHGETEEEAWRVARAIAAAFMYEDTVGAEEWPQNSMPRTASSEPSQALHTHGADVIAIEDELRSLRPQLNAADANAVQRTYTLLRELRRASRNNREQALAADDIAEMAERMLASAPINRPIEGNEY